MEEFEDIKIERNHKIKIILVSLILFLTSVIGVTYAYFSLNIIGNDEASSIEMDTAGIEITFTDGPEIEINDIFSGASVVKTFTVSNTGTVTAYYDIKVDDVFGTFINDELVYTLSGTNGGGSVSQTIMPNNDGLLKAKVSIAPGVTQTFTLTVTFKETGSNQNYNQTASYKGKIQIISPYQNTANGVSNIKLVDRIFLDNTAYPMNTTSKYVTGSTGIVFSKTGGVGFSGYYIDEEEVNFTSASNRSLGTTIELDSNSGTFRLTGATGTSKTYTTADIGKFTCYHTNSTYCFNEPQEYLYKILEVSGSTVTRVERYVAKPDRTSWNGLGLYYTSENTMDNKTTYFFRGSVTNNYVSFAGDLWRIVRINEDGTIRLIKQTNYTTSAYNSTKNNRMYVGYMYGTTSDPYTNDNPSTIKTKVEQYYDSKLASLSSYLAPIYFCNDRSTTSTSTTTVYFNAYRRLYSAKAPVYKCGTSQAAEDRDLFTMTTDTRGNKKLTKSVGLLTVDEIAYAGGLYARISNSYLNNNTNWYTASPWTFISSNARIVDGRAGGFTDYSNSNNSYGVRPVINLKADVLVSGGTGSANNPYVIVTN